MDRNKYEYAYIQEDINVLAHYYKEQLNWRSTSETESSRLPQLFGQ